MAASCFADTVIRIEINSEALKQAHHNVVINQIKNIVIIEGVVHKILSPLQTDPQFINPEPVILGPPRAGLTPKAIQDLIHLRPKEILYISCEPTSQQSNVTHLMDNGYMLTKIQPIDQFPHTPHIKNIILLKHQTVSIYVSNAI